MNQTRAIQKPFVSSEMQDSSNLDGIKTNILREACCSSISYITGSL